MKYILHELDTKLEERGHHFVRYADDCSVYLRSRKSAHRVIASISVYLEDCLKLKVNKEKSKVSRPSQSSLLDFILWQQSGMEDAYCSEIYKCHQGENKGAYQA
ncbi:reverse transcriptase domain-containing protein [Algibacter miyuki]|uniref:reverse transcriptase domain-containing protein n=1 Tax=Algibacter miyuki TaxID=1306933 RepID=UPI003B00185E